MPRKKAFIIIGVFLAVVFGVIALLAIFIAEPRDHNNTRSAKMGDNFFDISGVNAMDTFSCDPDTLGKQVGFSGGYRPIKMNGLPIYTLCDEHVKPKLTPAGQQIVNDLRSFLINRLNLGAGRSKLWLENVVINEQGKIVYYSPSAIVILHGNEKPGDSAIKKENDALMNRAVPVIDSLQPMLLKITFEPAHVKGKAAPYLVGNMSWFKQ